MDRERIAAFFFSLCIALFASLGTSSEAAKAMAGDEKTSVPINNSKKSLMDFNSFVYQ